MNNDLISRSALVETIEKSRKAHASVRSRLTVGDMEQMIKGARSVDAEVVRHGRWTRLGPNWHECSVCKARTSIFSGTKCYCPNCGALMDGEVIP